MDQILQKARDLARAILESDAFARLRAVENAVLSDSAAVEMTEKYEQAAMALHGKETRMEAISPEEKRSFQELKEKISGHPGLQELMEAQGDYRSLMEAVNGTIHETLQAGFEGEDEDGSPVEGGGTSRIILP